jgi:formate dehydrogenase assembly factor FdhD
MAMKAVGVMMQEHWIEFRRKVHAIGRVMEAEFGDTTANIVTESTDEESEDRFSTRSQCGISATNTSSEEIDRPT